MGTNDLSEEWPPKHEAIDEWFTKQPPDVVLRCEGIDLPCHKHILMDQSNYFRAMFTTEMLESTQRFIELHDVHADILKILVRNAYTKDLRLKHSTVCDILVGACMLQFDGVIKRCVFYLMKTVDVTNCLTVMAVTEFLPVPQVYNLAKKHALWYFDDLIRTEQFLELPFDVIVSYLSEDLLRTKNELYVFLAAVKWLKHLCQERAGYVERVLNTVRVEVLTLEHVKKLTTHSYAKTQLKWGKLLNERIKVLMSEKDDSEILQKNLRQKRSIPYELWRVGGTLVSKGHTEWATDISQITLTSEGEDKVITRVPLLEQSLKENISGHKACMVGTDLYISGGELGLGRSKWCMEVSCFDTLRKLWSRKTNLLAPRRHHSVIAWDQYLYLIGGFGKHRILQSSVHCYDTKKDVWKELPHLNAAVLSPAVGLCRDRLYVIRHNIEYLASGALTWTILNVPLPYRIGIHCCVCIDSCIYISGSYIPDIIKLNVDSLKTEKLGSFAHSTGPLEIIGRTIYRVAGEESKSVECFNVDTMEVEKIKDLPTITTDFSLVKGVNFPDFKRVT